MECPNCRLTSPESAIRCDCGYNFQTLDSKPLPRMWVGFVLSAVILGFEFIVPIGSGQGAPRPDPGFVFLIIVLPSWIYWLWCVHRYHDILTSVPGCHHPISPGQAVGRHLIPFYSLYWVFKWPADVASFVNWRTQSSRMQGWIPGLMVLGGFLMRAVDASIGMALVFASGVYISRQIRNALAAPPVPASAMAHPGPPSSLGLS